MRLPGNLTPEIWFLLVLCLLLLLVYLQFIPTLS
jgi:hypothetical protein